jgi:hypothetical protein
VVAVPPDTIVLDTVTLPSGARDVIAYPRDGVTWLGFTEPDGSLASAMGLHTGSREAQVEATAYLEDGWGLAYGAVAPSIVRAEIRNDDGHSFPASIATLPDGFDEEYRVVWGVGERCQQRCEVVGFDERGLEYDHSDPRVFGPLPTTDERLAALRAHADSSMRYYATAYLRETEENRRLLDSHMSLTRSSRSWTAMGSTSSA